MILLLSVCVCVFDNLKTTVCTVLLKFIHQGVGYK